MGARILDRGSRRPDAHRPCPVCGPSRRHPANKVRKVLGVWRDEDGGERTWCIRCGNGSTGQVGTEREEWAAQNARDRAGLANWLWRRSQPIEGTLGELYFRQGRAIQCRLPATVRYLPGCGQYSHAVISAFGRVQERASGLLSISGKVSAVHLTILSGDGLSRLSKRMIGAVAGQPIVLAPMNDALGLAICEGIEDALSVHEATGLGAWAAGAATFLPKLADAVPDYCDRVSIVTDPDAQGLKMARRLSDRLQHRDFNAELRSLGVTPCMRAV